MRELFQNIIRELETGETIAMATIVKRKGSVPREVGAKMLVHRGGKISGTVGGGCGEAEVWRAALNVIDTKRPHTVQVDLTEEIAMESQGVCGGIFDVFIQSWHTAALPGQPGMQDLAQAIDDALESERAVVLATIIAAGGAWRACVGQQMLVHENGEILGSLSLPNAPTGLAAQLVEAAQKAIIAGKPHIEHVRVTSIGADVSDQGAGKLDKPRPYPGADVSDQGGDKPRPYHIRTRPPGLSRVGVGPVQLARATNTSEAALPADSRIASDTQTSADNTWAEIFIEPFVPPPVLLIAGAGHIAAPLAAIAHIMNFSVSVTDDRASFANRERFPSAKQLLVGDIESTLRNYPITSRTHIVLVTRAHAHDVQGLRAIIDSPAAYIGMIGSQRRVWAVFKLLHEEGVPAEKLARVRAPIGLDFGSSTPEEIALGIMAEITMLRHGGTGKVMSEPLRERYMERLRAFDKSLQ